MEKKQIFNVTKVLDSFGDPVSANYRNLFADTSFDPTELDYWVKRLKYLGVPFTYAEVETSRGRTNKTTGERRTLKQYALFAHASALEDKREVKDNSRPSPYDPTCGGSCFYVTLSLRRS